MPNRTLTQRVAVLEQKVEVLETLPARVAALELQILQLRDEVRGEFSELRREIAGGTNLLRNELRAEIRQGDEETRRYMRVLHEDVIARITALGDVRR
jgi:hypothetical protein